MSLPVRGAKPISHSESSATHHFRFRLKVVIGTTSPCAPDQTRWEALILIGLIK
jgi:hypothetical protein